jgi:hypothetical protein
MAEVMQDISYGIRGYVPVDQEEARGFIRVTFAFSPGCSGGCGPS